MKTYFKFSTVETYPTSLLYFSDTAHSMSFHFIYFHYGIVLGCEYAHTLLCIHLQLDIDLSPVCTL